MPGTSHTQISFRCVVCSFHKKTLRNYYQFRFQGIKYYQVKSKVFFKHFSLLILCIITQNTTNFFLGHFVPLAICCFGHFVPLGIMSFGHFIPLGILSYLDKMTFGHFVYGHFVILGHFVTLGISSQNQESIFSNFLDIIKHLSIKQTITKEIFYNPCV